VSRAVWALSPPSTHPRSPLDSPGQKDSDGLGDSARLASPGQISLPPTVGASCANGAGEAQKHKTRLVGGLRPANRGYERRRNPHISKSQPFVKRQFWRTAKLCPEIARALRRDLSRTETLCRPNSTTTN
jgi:hypothetical protein